jgi:hypothetical protein
MLDGTDMEVSHQLSHFNKSQGLMIMKWQMKNLRAAP